MCGIMGVVTDGSPALERFDDGLRALNHRGPESSAVKKIMTPHTVCVLGHTRLRIIDVHERADQPMSEEEGVLWITYNGELYNHAELRAGLERKGHRFRTTSDTESILHLYEDLDGDVERMLGRLRGMFAFALFDKDSNRILLGRDRLGIKPLYWCDGPGGGLAFASEVRALVRAGLASGAPDPEGLGTYLTWGSVHGPTTAFEGVREVMPGTYVEWTPDGARIARWWTPRIEPKSSAFVDATRSLNEALVDAVTRHLIAERPVGIFLSGGVDSGAVARVAAQHAATRGVTVTFPEAGEGEGPVAAQLADALGMGHQLVPIQGTEIARDLAAILGAMDQPTSDGVNSWLVARAAHDAGFVVALSGLGGDELFGGYPSFRLVPRLASVSHAFGSALPLIRGWMTGPLTHRRPGSPIVRALGMADGYGAAYLAVRGLLSPHELRFHGVRVPLPVPPIVDGDNEPIDRVTLLEMTNYLPNQLLRDTDQMSMAHSLEVRVPLLDDKVVNVALALPGHVRAANGKQLLARASGARAFPKRPFAPPFERWLAGPLKDPVREALLSEELPLDDVVPAGLRYRLWSAFEEGRIHWSAPWAVAVLRLWPEANGLSW
jgi:asparagine synthase (glutamine-hydrolysing)